MQLKKLLIELSGQENNLPWGYLMGTPVFRERIIRVAREALKSKKGHDKFNHVSIICRQGRILAIGLNNQYKTHTQASKFRPEWCFLHSELSCIIKLKNKTGVDLAKCELYNVRIGKAGVCLLARPCMMCQKLVIAANFKNVYYTNNWGLFEKFEF